ncbi:hypothetical protein AB1Y20_014924 [Prymnesium parvum]|uniref:Rhodanese domain-containing protein n=1 Tax=Prymnesium parvum TaxID=97485 RepID=A0AB34JYW7_PRYPA
MTHESNKKVLVIGAVAGGASMAARLRRLDEDANIILFEKGPDPSFANCGMPYYIGGEIEDRSKLSVHTPKSLKDMLNVDVRVLSEIIKIDGDAQVVTVKEVATGSEYTETYTELVFSVGAKPFLPPIPGIDRPGNLSLRNLEDMDKIVNWMSLGKQDAVKTAVVAGGGFIGVEMAEQLRVKGLQVTLVEALPQLMAPLDPEMASMVQHQLESNGVEVILNSPISAFEPKADENARGSQVVLNDGRRMDADVVILGLGVRPDTDLAKAAGLKLSPRGAIVVDEQMRTNVKNIWAVGDAVEVRNPITGGEWLVALAGPANRQGRLCADNICGKAKAYKGTFGSSAVRVFGVTAAGTGMNERGLKMAGIPYACVHLHPTSHASYYPGSCMIALKILFQSEGSDVGKLLGAQAVGADGADKAVDSLATALQAGMNVHDLADLELCYAPPVGSAKSPINLAGMIAQDVLDGLVSIVQWTDLSKLAEDPDVHLLDVRKPGEVAQKPLHAKAQNIPVQELRARVDEIPRDKRIVTFCASGKRGYFAARILMQRGFARVDNLDGALATIHASPLMKSK